MKVISALLLLIATYIFGSLAIDTGRWLFYFLTIVPLVVAFNLIIKALKGNGKQ